MPASRSAPSKPPASVDPALISAALAVFRAEGYGGATLDQIARQANIDPDTLLAQYGDKATLLTALLTANSPLPNLESLFDAAPGADEPADELLRDVMRRAVKAIDAHPDFIDLVAVDMQATNGAFVAGMSTR